MLKVGTRVRIKGGPFSGREGRVIGFFPTEEFPYELKVPARPGDPGDASDGPFLYPIYTARELKEI